MKRLEEAAPSASAAPTDPSLLSFGFVTIESQGKSHLQMPLSTYCRPVDPRLPVIDLHAEDDEDSDDEDRKLPAKEHAIVDLTHSDDDEEEVDEIVEEVAPVEDRLVVGHVPDPAVIITLSASPTFDEPEPKRRKQNQSLFDANLDELEAAFTYYDADSTDSKEEYHFKFDTGVTPLLQGDPRLPDAVSNDYFSYQDNESTAQLKRILRLNYEEAANSYDRSLLSQEEMITTNVAHDEEGSEESYEDETISFTSIPIASDLLVQPHLVPHTILPQKMKTSQLLLVQPLLVPHTTHPLRVRTSQVSLPTTRTLSEISNAPSLGRLYQLSKIKLLFGQMISTDLLLRATLTASYPVNTIHKTMDSSTMKKMMNCQS